MAATETTFSEPPTIAELVRKYPPGRITGWDSTNPPAVERAFRVGYSIGASRCAHCDLEAAADFEDRLHERRGDIYWGKGVAYDPDLDDLWDVELSRWSDRRAAVLRGATQGAIEMVRARAQGVKKGIPAWLSELRDWAAEEPIQVGWDHAKPPDWPEPDSPSLGLDDVPKRLWSEVFGMWVGFVAPNEIPVNPNSEPPPRSAPQPNPTTRPWSPPAPAPKVHLTRADQIEIRPPHWLLRGMLERDTFALIFGDPGSGKSFLAIDWACRIATGTSWRGQLVRGGPVVYVAGEGQQGFGRRIRAWSEHHGVSLAGVPLYLAPAVVIPVVTDLVGLINAIDTGITAVGKPALIVLRHAGPLLRRRR